MKLKKVIQIIILLFICSIITYGLYTFYTAQTKKRNTSAPAAPNKALKVYYNAFWMSNQDTYKNSFLRDILEKSLNRPIELGTTPEESDILVESLFGESIVTSKDWLYSFFFTGEPRSTYHPEDYSVVLGYTDDIPNHQIKCPLFAMYTYARPNHKEPFSLSSPLHPRIPPIRGVICIISSEGHSVRQKCIQMLEDAGVPMYYGGKYKNNIGGPIQAEHSSPEFYEILSKYRCVIAMENTDIEYYITEKIFHGFSSKTVPIYWGSKHVTEVFNEERFVNVTEPDSPEWITTVRRLLDDDVYYTKTLLQPVYAGGSPSITIDTISADIKKVLHV
jgi:hypothetical protein